MAPIWEIPKSAIHHSVRLLVETSPILSSLVMPDFRSPLENLSPKSTNCLVEIFSHLPSYFVAKTSSFGNFFKELCAISNNLVIDISFKF